MSRDRYPVVVRVVVACCTLLTLLAPRFADAEPRSTPLIAGMPVVNGIVKAAVQVGNTLYLGGSFTHAGIASGRFVTVSATTGAPQPMADRVDGNVDRIVPDGAGGWYLAGRRLFMGTTLSKTVVHLLADGSVDPGFAPLEIPLAQINAMVLHNGLLYIGGSFTEITGQPRGRLAALDAVTGALQPFDGELDGPVMSLEASATTLYVGGAFITAKGTSRHKLAAYDIASGALTSWSADVGGFGVVRALQLVSTTLYVGGGFETIGGVPRNHLAALNTLVDTNNVTPWDPQATSTVLALELVGQTLVVGGVFDQLSGSIRLHLGAYNTTTGTLLAWAPNPNHNVLTLASNPVNTSVYVGGDFTMIGGVERSHVAEVEIALGTISPWNPGPIGSVEAIARQGTSVALGGFFAGLGAQQRRGVAAIDLGTLTLTNWGADVTGGYVGAMASLGNVIYVGGTFTTVNGVPRQRLAAIHLSGALEAWDPSVEGEAVHALAATNTRIFVGGWFTQAGGVAATNLAAVDPINGAPVAPAIDASGVIYTLRAVAGRVYVGGDFDMLAGAPRSNIGALSAADGSLDAWAPSTDGPVQAIDVLDSRVYIGGSFLAVNGVARTDLAAVAASDAALDSGFTPNILGGSVTGIKTAFNSILVGGAFTMVNGVPRSGGITLTPDTGALRMWDADFEFGTSANGFVLTGAGVWAIGGFRWMEPTQTLLPGLAFFPDAIPTLAPIPNINTQEDLGAGASLGATDEVLSPALFGFRAVSSNPSLIDAGGLTFSFNGASWTLSITPKPNASGSATISVTMDDGLFFVQRQFTLNVAPVNDPPIISGLGNAMMLKDTTYTKAFNIFDVDDPPSLFALSMSSSNQALVPDANIQASGALSDRVLQITPAAGQTGSVEITISASDGKDTTIITFTLTVLAENTPPTITPIASQTTAMGVAVGPLSFTVADAEGGPLDVFASSNNVTLVPQDNLVLAGSDSNRTLTVTPAPGQAGLATITITVTDALDGSASTAFQLTVNGLPPGPPQNFQATVVNTEVTLTWQPPVTGGAPTTYVLEGGTTPGGSDLPTTPVGLVTSYVATLPVGTYYLRLRAANDFGLSTPSNEITVIVSSGLPSVPGAPTGLVSGVSAAFVVLYWLPPTTGGQPTHYIIEAGSAWGQADLASVPTQTAATGVQIQGVPNGVYYVRLRAANAQGVGPASNEVVITVGPASNCAAAPAAPVGLTPTVQGAVVTLSWAPGPGDPPTAYRIRVGTAPGQVDLGEIPINSVGTSLMAMAPPGTYYLHMIALNACGASGPSNEVSLTVGSAPPPPGPVTGLTWSLGPNNTVTLQWQPANGEVRSYVVVAGSAPGGHDLAVVPTGTTATNLSVSGVGPGTYYVYVRATNNGGHGGASNVIAVVVP